MNNDSFGCGCCIAYLCSGGKHPFQSSMHRVPEARVLAFVAIPKLDCCLCSNGNGNGNDNQAWYCKPIHSRSHHTSLRYRYRCGRMYASSCLQNIRAGRRAPLSRLGIRDPGHRELVDRLTGKLQALRWDVRTALVCVVWCGVECCLLRGPMSRTSDKHGTARPCPR